MSGKVLVWCQDFLTERNAVLAFQEKWSDTIEFENGTPQESTLSPCFFNYAMNTFLKLKFPQGIKVITYADDIVLYYQNHRNPMRPLQAALDIVTDAASEAGFLFAHVKSKAMWFFGLNPDTNLHFNNLPVEWEDHFNYLGVVIDKHLRLHWHAEYIEARTNSSANALRELASLSGVNCHILRRIFNATVRATLDYGSEVLNKMSQSQLNRLQRAQNAALRSCLGVSKWTPIVNIHSELNILPVSNRTDITHAKFIDKILQNTNHQLQPYVEAAFENPYHGAKHKNSWVAKSALTYKKLTSKAPAPPNEAPLPPAEPWSKVLIVFRPKKLEPG